MKTKKYTLPKEFGMKWVEALRSTPESMHGKGQYFNPYNGCYCGMGLGFKASDIPLVEDGMFPIGREDKSLFNVDKDGDTLWMQLYSLNDNNGYTFPEIASWIETNVELI